ncbi:MAG TPA: hypothetical protein VK983_04760 [Candidatus Limnocylindrales bacterium]|nr:hypothetical protein [Candidatus Limnocylindrales bacterium]
MTNQPNHLPQETVPVYRIENPSIAASPDGITSHEDLVGQWFSPSLSTAATYLRKSTRTFGPNGGPVEGTRLVVAQVPIDQLDRYHVSQHPIAAGMDVENDNYIVPRDGSVPVTEVPLDEVLDGLHGKLGNIRHFMEAKQRVAAHVGQLMIDGSNRE